MLHNCNCSEVNLLECVRTGVPAGGAGTIREPGGVTDRITWYHSCYSAAVGWVAVCVCVCEREGVTLLCCLLN